MCHYHLRDAERVSEVMERDVIVVSVDAHEEVTEDADLNLEFI